MRKEIKVFFDKNTWSEIVTLSDTERQKWIDRVKKADDSYGLDIHYSPVNLFELLKGTNEDYFRHCQTELKVAAVLTREHLLENPWDHVRRASVTLVGLGLPEIDGSFLELIRTIVKASHYSKVESLVAYFRSYIVNFQSDWLDFTKETVQNIKNELTAEKIKTFVSSSYRPRRLIELWRGFRQHFRLIEPEFSRLDWTEVYSKLPSFRYWSQIQIRYIDRLLLENRQPEASDYFDIEQTVYFEIMDYLVTNDKKFRSLLEETSEAELHDRVLTVNEFMQNISTLTKRAICDSSSKWIELSRN